MVLDTFLKYLKLDNNQELLEKAKDNLKMSINYIIKNINRLTMLTNDSKAL